LKGTIFQVTYALQSQAAVLAYLAVSSDGSNII